MLEEFRRASSVTFDTFVACNFSIVGPLGLETPLKSRGAAVSPSHRARLPRHLAPPLLSAEHLTGSLTSTLPALCCGTQQRRGRRRGAVARRSRDDLAGSFVTEEAVEG